MLGVNVWNDSPGDSAANQLLNVGYNVMKRYVFT